MTPERSHSRHGTSRGERGGWQGDGFGVQLCGPYPVIGLAKGTGPAPADATLLLLDEDPPELPKGERLRELRHGDGRLFMAIDDYGELGLRITAPRFGEHHVSRDGSTVNSRPGGLPLWRWQRLLIGQVLPLVAALRGLEVLHASAVSYGGLAFAFTGPSGAGKSTVAAQLALRGHRLLTDDVLAISLTASGFPQAHRGSTALSVRGEDADLAARLVQSGIATPIGSDGKEHVLLAAADRRMPLGAVYRLDQDGDGKEPIGVPTDPSLADLMSCSYIKYIRTPARRVTQFEVMAAIAQHCPVVPLNSGSGLTSAQLAVELESHMAAIVSGSTG
jgi:hypothetical protein